MILLDPIRLSALHLLLCGHTQREGFPSLALRLASRAATALFARSERCSGVMVSSDRLPPILPPILPPFAPCLRKYSNTSGGSFFFATLLS